MSKILNQFTPEQLQELSAHGYSTSVAEDGSPYLAKESGEVGAYLTAKNGNIYAFVKAGDEVLFQGRMQEYSPSEGLSQALNQLDGEFNKAMEREGKSVEEIAQANESVPLPLALLDKNSVRESHLEGAAQTLSAIGVDVSPDALSLGYEQPSNALTQAGFLRVSRGDEPAAYVLPLVDGHTQMVVVNDGVGAVATFGPTGKELISEVLPIEASKEYPLAVAEASRQRAPLELVGVKPLYPIIEHKSGSIGAYLESEGFFELSPEGADKDPSQKAFSRALGEGVGQLLVVPNDPEGAVVVSTLTPGGEVTLGHDGKPLVDELNVARTEGESLEDYFTKKVAAGVLIADKQAGELTEGEQKPSVEKPKPMSELAPESQAKRRGWLEFPYVADVAKNLKKVANETANLGTKLANRTFLIGAFLEGYRQGRETVETAKQAVGVVAEAVKDTVEATLNTERAKARRVLMAEGRTTPDGRPIKPHMIKRYGREKELKQCKIEGVVVSETPKSFTVLLSDTNTAVLIPRSKVPPELAPDATGKVKLVWDFKADRAVSPNQEKARGKQVNRSSQLDQ